MIERLIEYSIRNRFLVLIAAAVLAAAGVFALLDTPVDAVPDLSENQVIVFTDWMGRSPREIEDQITYPLSRKLQGLAGVRAVRSSSEFNFSMITIIFNDRIDFYFARQRVAEKLAQASTFLPAGVVPYLAPDATALGQIFWYTLEADAAHPQEPGRLWALNKFYIAPQLNAAAGVADVATVGGMPLEYQIDVRPEALRAYGITLGELYAAVAKSNLPSGGGVIQKNNAEYIVRGVGWLRDKRDIEQTVIKQVSGTPIYVETIATVQLGVGFRRSVYEKDGNEVTGGVVLMRHQENPLAVTQRVKQKIQELQPGLPQGVHIVPAYDRTRLIHGAIHTLREVMWHEMLIASLAILLILVHVRSVLVICVTLPLSVLFSFLLMWLLRRLGIVDIQANIMSLAGITISIGILVDQAIVMTENATHHLKDHFGDRRVTGDIRELVVAPCRTVGRPIFFSVMIMLLSFIPVFALSGREGQLFHPLAFTKSFAILGVALISVTVVPALIPTFLKGRLRSEEENPIVRSFIHIYKPLLTWALPRRNLVMWMFAVLLVLAAGIFPLQALLGMGASRPAWETCFFVVFFCVTGLTVIFTRGLRWQILSFVSLVLLGLWSWHFQKIGVSFMPALDEGVTLDMPVTVPRASVTEAADDLKARDALLRGFPEVESVIGKAGRADTPTDPAPLDMVETFINFRPKELWPKRVLRFDDAVQQTRAGWDRLVAEGFVAAPGAPHENPLPLRERVAAQPPGEGAGPSAISDLRFEIAKGGWGSSAANAPVDRDSTALLNDATQKALERFDETLRELASLRYREFERELGPRLTRFAVDWLVREIGQGGWGSSAANAPVEPGQDFATGLDTANAQPPGEGADISQISNLKSAIADESIAQGAMPTLAVGMRVRHPSVDMLDRWESDFGPWLARNPSPEDVARLSRDVAVALQEAGAIDDVVAALERRPRGLARVAEWLHTALGGSPTTLEDELLQVVIAERASLWRERVAEINWELLDQGAESYTAYAQEELLKSAATQGLLKGAPRGAESARFTAAALAVQLGRDADAAAFEPLLPLREPLVSHFKRRVYLWPRRGGTAGDLVDDEMRTRVMQVPGWGNIFTQPIINRIEMLSTGVRTDIGVKVFGPDLATIDRVGRSIETALKPISGARDVVANPIMGKGYLEIDIDRQQAARFGISVEDIQNEIEVALAGRAVTYTVEKRERFPVRVRYARDSRTDEDAIRRLLISPGGTAAKTGMTDGAGAGGDGASSTTMPSGARSVATNDASSGAGHTASPSHSARGRPLIPLAAVADVRIVEGPAMIKSENGRLLNYVTLNVRGRDAVGFVDEAQRVVAQKVSLPEGVHIEWSGEFEHQVRAARTLRLVFPAVIVLIFVILYLTYRDLADAALMMLAVPEALAGGAFFLYFFPKIMHGWSTPPLDFSVAVWVGFIACFGMATETGIIMLVYLREAIDKRGGLERIGSLEELRQAVIEGAVHRLRPKLLTEGVAILAIFPMVFARGVGGEVLAPMALPVLGGLLISDEVVDLFLPVRFYWVRRARWLKLHGRVGQAAEHLTIR